MGIIKGACSNQPEMRRLIVVIGLTCIALGAFAQRGFDFGLNLGTTQNHLSSILPIPDKTGFDYAAGAYFRHSINERYSWRTGINAGFDRASFPAAPNRLDAYGLIEFYFNQQNVMEGGKKIVPYIALGLGYFVDFKEYETAKGRSLDYMAVYTATQNADYLAKANQLMVKYWLRNTLIPFNVGVRYTPTPKISIALEWAVRKNIQMDYNMAEPAYTPLQTNWRSYFSVTVGALFSNYCRTCPFYENLRKQR